MRNSLKTSPEHRKTFEQFEVLKQEVIQRSVGVKKLYLSLEEVVTGLVQRFEESSDICQAIDLLKRILFTFNNLAEVNGLL